MGGTGLIEPAILGAGGLVAPIISTPALSILLIAPIFLLGSEQPGGQSFFELQDVCSLFKNSSRSRATRSRVSA